MYNTNCLKQFNKFKYLILIAFIMLISVSAFSAPILITHAETSTYYLIKDNTTFKINDPLHSDLSGEFQICKTWYVQSTTINDEVVDSITYKTVIYNGIRGKVDKSKLSIKTTALTTSPYFVMDSKTIAGNTTFYKDNNLSTMYPTALSPNSDFTFIGEATPQNLYFIKSSDGNFGFINKTNSNLELSNITNPNAIDPDNIINNGDNNNLIPPTTTDVEPTNNLLKILLITAICILSVLVVFLIFKPTKTKKSSKSRDDFSE